MLVICVVPGGQDNQNLEDAGPEANLDTQYAFGLAYPTPGTFYSVGGSPSAFTPDTKTPSNTNEPYDNVRNMFP
jgi:tripeptidyl-peptidase-1